MADFVFSSVSTTQRKWHVASKRQCDESIQELLTQRTSATLFGAMKSDEEL